LHELSRVDKHRSLHLIALTLAPFLLVRGHRLDMHVSTPLVRGAVIGRFGPAGDVIHCYEQFKPKKAQVLEAEPGD